VQIPTAESDEFGVEMERRASDALTYFRRRAGLPEPEALTGPSERSDAGPGGAR